MYAEDGELLPAALPTAARLEEQPSRQPAQVYTLLIKRDLSGTQKTCHTRHESCHPFAPRLFFLSASPLSLSLPPPPLFISPLSLYISLPICLHRCLVDVQLSRFGELWAYKRGVLKALLGCVAEEADEFRDGGQKVRVPPLTVLNTRPCITGEESTNAMFTH